MPNNAPNQNTWDMSPPQRPTTNHFNGVAKIDDATYAPDAQTMPSAAEYNTLCALVVAYGQVAPNAVISVQGGTTPTVLGVASMKSAFVPSSVTVTRNGTGDVSLTWAAGTFPGSVLNPTASLNAGALGQIDAVAITNGVRVRTANAAGTATDYSFTVLVR